MNKATGLSDQQPLSKAVSDLTAIDRCGFLTALNMIGIHKLEDFIQI